MHTSFLAISGRKSVLKNQIKPFWADRRTRFEGAKKRVRPARRGLRPRGHSGVLDAGMNTRMKVFGLPIFCASRLALFAPFAGVGSQERHQPEGKAVPASLRSKRIPRIGPSGVTGEDAFPRAG